MLQILKYFFGVIAVIILIYVLVIIVRTVISYTGSTTVATAVATTTKVTASTTSGFTFQSWLANFHMFTQAPIQVVYPDSRNSFYSQPDNGVSGVQLYWQGLNDAPNDHPTDWAPVGSFDSQWSNNPVINPSKINRNTEPASQDSRKIQVYQGSNTVVKNDMVISGIAYYQVFADRYFPLVVRDKSGNTLGVVKAFANGNVRDDGYVPFRAVLSFSNSSSQSGYLVFGFKTETVVPVFFKNNYQINNMPNLIYNSPYNTNTNPLNNNCVIGGCSMQFCMDQSDTRNTISSCEYRPAYACYQHATCERNQDTGQCGWRIDNSLATCLQQNN